MDGTDAELIERFRRGDRSAFARLASRWDEKAFALAYRLTLDRAEAEDVKQTALLKAYQNVATFNGRAAFSTWLYRVVVNLCRDRQRSGRSRERTLRRAAQAPRAAPVSPAAAMERTETSRRVGDAVASLPAAMREVVVMRHYHELRFAEIAQIVGAPPSTVKSRMAQGLKLLREMLEKDHEQ